MSTTTAKRQDAVINTQFPKFNWIWIALITLMTGLYGLVTMNKIKNLKKQVEYARNVGIVVDLPVDQSMYDCSRWYLNNHKPQEKWVSQFKDREFDLNKIRHIMQNGKPVRYVDPQNNDMIRIIDPESGEWIIVNPITCEIYQVSPAHFKHVTDDL